MAAQEVETLRKLSEHPGIISLEAAFFSASTRQVFIVTEFIAGSHLFSHLVCRAEPLPEPEASHIVAQLSDALAFCHGKGVVHRDVKLENVLVSSVDVQLVEQSDCEDGAVWRTQELFSVKLCDFGLAKTLTAHAARTPVGTPNYAAPEVVPAASFYDAYKADAFSLGVLIFVLLCMGFPCKDGGEGSHKEHKRWLDLSFGARSLLDGLLMHDPVKRFALTDVVKHQWVAKLKIQDITAEHAAVNRYRRPRSQSKTTALEMIPSQSPKSRVQDHVLAGILTLNRAVVELQHERGMACWALTQSPGFGGIGGFEQLRRHIRLTDGRIAEAKGFLEETLTLTLTLSGGPDDKSHASVQTGTLSSSTLVSTRLTAVIKDIERARSMALKRELATSGPWVSFDEVFMAYSQVCGSLSEVVAQRIKAVSGGPEGRLTVRRFRLFSAAAELIGKERALGLSAWICKYPDDSPSRNSDAMPLARMRRLSEILGARKVLLGTILDESSATHGDVVATTTGLLGSLVGEEGEPPLLSAADISALEYFEERVLDPRLAQTAPPAEWWTTLTQLMKQIHGRIAIDLVAGLRAVPCDREAAANRGSGEVQPHVSSGTKKIPKQLVGCGCRQGLKRLLQTLVDGL
ncbi:unnamed protein product [Polarella glacialis]|uniref:Protein kinase domain-containing protein n=1 Tax=Polarella glacialis TaxID=89957 RepID=A0A813HV79_POLGL|nr:unnamed protein product [Polarella glacialis]